MSYFNNFDYKQVMEIVAVLNGKVIVIGNFNELTNECCVSTDVNRFSEKKLCDILLKVFGKNVSMKFENLTESKTVFLEKLSFIRRGRVLSTEIFAQYGENSIHVGKHTHGGERSNNNVIISAKVNPLIAHELNSILIERFGLSVKIKYLSNELGQYPA